MTGAPKRLRASHSTAAVITLMAEAAEKGLGYAEISAKAKANVDLRARASRREEKVRCKNTRTEARLLKIPGFTNVSKADALAATRE